MLTYGHFIGGKPVAGTSGRTGEVFQPMDGTVRGTVALAAAAEVRAAVLNAKKAQLAWGATNPQRRARVMMKFYELIVKHTEELADILAREHGKTIADAKGDIQRGIEVLEFSFGVPHLMKGEFTDQAGPGIDTYSMRQPLGVVAGITPFNFPAMIPLWKLAPAIACGNAFILKPSERDPGVPMRLAELFIEAGGPPGILNIDTYSMRQPLGVVAGITPVQFPRDDPAVEARARPSLAATPSSSSRASATPACRCGSPNCSSKPAALPASSTSSTATRLRSTPFSTIPTSPRSASSARRRSRNTFTRAARRRESACTASAAPRTTWSSCPTPTWTRRSTR